jgi:hypothetical protein
MGLHAVALARAPTSNRTRNTPMRTTSRLALAAVLLSSLTLGGLAGCKDKGKDKGGDPAGKGGAAEKATGPLKMTAEEFFQDYSSTTDGMKLLAKYRDGVVVSGKVKQPMDATEVGGGYNVWIEAGGTKWIDLGFADNGAVAKAKGFKAGDAITAACQVGGMSDNYIMNIDCVLQ